MAQEPQKMQVYNTLNHIDLDIQSSAWLTKQLLRAVANSLTFGKDRIVWPESQNLGNTCIDIDLGTAHHQWFKRKDPIAGSLALYSSRAKNILQLNIHLGLALHRWIQIRVLVYRLVNNWVGEDCQPQIAKSRQTSCGHKYCPIVDAKVLQHFQSLTYILQV